MCTKPRSRQNCFVWLGLSPACKETGSGEIDRLVDGALFSQVSVVTHLVESALSCLNCSTWEELT